MAPRRQAAPEGSMPPPSRPSSPGGEEIDEVGLFAVIVDDLYSKLTRTRYVSDSIL